MSKNKGRKELVGVVLSLPTPTMKDGAIDFPALGRLVSSLVDQGIVRGKGVLMVAGGVGEGQFVTAEEQERMVEVAVEAADGKVPIMTALYDTCTKDAVKRAKTSTEAGASLLEVLPPHYLRPLDEEVFTHIRMIHDATEAGLMLYNIPWAATNFEFKPQLLQTLIGLDNVAGLKWNSLLEDNWVDVLRMFSDKLNIIDNTAMTSMAYWLGAKGHLSLLGVVAPKIDLHLLSLIEDKKYSEFEKECTKIRAGVHEAFDSLQRGDEGLGYAGIGEAAASKAIYEALGRDFGPPIPPQIRIGKQTIARIRQILERSEMFDSPEIRALKRA